MIMRTDDEIDEQMNLAVDSIDAGRSKWPGMSYEQGVDAALRWVRGESEDKPMEE
jgi:hypothetical protein